MLGMASAANAANCSGYPFTFSNGTIADADQVNSNFNTIMNCANSNLAPITSPSFTGNVGIGTSSPASQLDVVDQAMASTRGLVVDEYYSGAGAALLNFRKARGTLSSPT